jgi:hypothetical protein
MLNVVNNLKGKEMDIDLNIDVQRLVDDFCLVTYCKANNKPYKDSMAYCRIMDRGYELYNLAEVEAKHRKAKMDVRIFEAFYPQLKDKKT